MEAAPASVPRPETAQHSGLRRQLGLGSATAAVASEAIAVGIFLTPAGMAKSLGSPLWLLLVWLAMGLMALAGALCYGRLAARYPEAGGGYVYLREAYGEAVAFLYGWKCFLVMDPGVTAALAVGMSSYAAYLLDFSGWKTKLVAIAAIAAVAGLNIRGTLLGAALLRRLTWLKFALLGLLPLWAFALGRGDWSNFLPFAAQRPGSAPLLPALAGALVAAFFSFGGWWEMGKLGGEVRDPQRTLPRAFILGVLAVTAVYILTSAVFIYLVPIEQVASDQTFVAQAGQQLFGSLGGKVLAGVVVLCVLGSLAAVVISAPRVYYAMARDRVFFSGLADLHPRFGTPARAIALQAAMAILLVALGTFAQIIAYFVFVTVCFIGLTVASLLFLREGDGRRRFHTLFAPVAFLAMLLPLLLLLLAENTQQALLGVAVVGLGAVAYFLRWGKGYSSPAT